MCRVVAALLTIMKDWSDQQQIIGGINCDISLIRCKEGMRYRLLWSEF